MMAAIGPLLFNGPIDDGSAMLGAIAAITAKMILLWATRRWRNQ